jgi:D-alanyl-D-alanine carboxypeptidase/D-alanyl-D-alanine-endopeptidase (penicillin-binding protein 4)
MKIFCIIILQISTYCSQLNTLISQYLEKSVAENVNVSMSIRKIDSGEEIFAYQSKMALPPASTLKLSTTGTAIDILGSDYTFKTQILKNGPIENNILYGDLIFASECDFSFGSKRLGSNTLKEIVDILKSKNISRITGNMKIEENQHFNIPSEWLIGDLGNYYGAYPKQFNFNENFYTVYFNAGENVGDSAMVSRIFPISESWKITNLVKTAEKGTGDRVNIINLAPSNEIVLTGTVPLKSINFEVKGTIPNINEVFLDLLKNECLKNGIEIEGNKSSEVSGSNTLTVLNSTALSIIAEHCNFRSVNFFADGLSNFLKSRTKDSVENYDKFLKSYWKSRGLSLSNFKFLDGSGLSPLNTLSAQTMTSFLAKMHESTQFEVFLKTIPRVGMTGTVGYLDPSGLTKGRIYAKSGSISGTRNYAGYFLDEKKEIYSFCIFLNGFNDTAQLFSRQLLQNLMFKMIDLNQ